MKKIWEGNAGRKIHGVIKTLKGSTYTRESKGAHTCPGLEPCLEKAREHPSLSHLADLWALHMWDMKDKAEK